MWCHGRRPVRHAAARGDPDHPGPDRTASTAFLDSSIAPIRTTCSIMKLFSSSSCYACATDGAIAIKFPSNVAAWTDLYLTLLSAAAAAAPLGWHWRRWRLGSGSCKLSVDNVKRDRKKERDRETSARDFLIDLLCVFCPSLFSHYFTSGLLSSGSSATFA